MDNPDGIVAKAEGLGSLSDDDFVDGGANGDGDGEMHDGDEQGRQGETPSFVSVVS